MITQSALVDSPAQGEEGSFQKLPELYNGALEEQKFLWLMSCIFIDCRRLLLELGGICLFRKHYKPLPRLCEEHVIAIKINKSGQGSLLVVLPLLFLFFDALNSGHFCSLWQLWLPHKVADQQ